MCIGMFAASVQAQAATSANYAIVASSIDGGGGVSSGGLYAQTLVIASPAGVTAGGLSVLTQGYAGQLNSAPAPVDDTRSHPPDASVAIPAAALLANDRDDDNDVLRLVQTDPVSEAGAAVTVVGQTIRYGGLIGFYGEDRFKYYLTDGNGEFASATVTLFVAPPAALQDPNSVEIYEQIDGRLLIRFRADLDPQWDEYVIEYTRDLAAPSWARIGSQPAGGDGLVEVLVDPSQAHGYFRAVARKREANP